MIRIFRITLTHRNVSLDDTEPNVLATRTTNPHCFAKLVTLYPPMPNFILNVLNAEAEFLDEIQTKVLRVFLLAITVANTVLP